jgi:hypothetical protein
MKNNIIKFLICSFVSAICVVSPMGDIELSQDKNEVIAETELNNLNAWQEIENTAGVLNQEYVANEPKDESDIIVEDNNEEVVTSPVLEFYDGWIKTSVNVRKEPNTESEVLEVFNFNHQIKYVDFNDEWVQIKYNDDIAYIYKAYVSDTVNTHREFTVPKNRGFKSFEPYNNFNPKYKQYKLQQHAYTDEYGLRKVNERYCIALGTYFFENVDNDIIGTYLDLILENGEVIHCILGDIKDDKHTDANNITTTKNGCLSEFIVDKNKLIPYVKTMGNISYTKQVWQSPVAKVIVYEKNFFDGQ